MKRLLSELFTLALVHDQQLFRTDLRAAMSKNGTFFNNFVWKFQKVSL